jgi:bifunctional ADP-heptose synthase (sugar kinase/adenylyltransferase)
VRATHFLAAATPDIYVKGGDYTLETLEQAERRTVEQAGGRIELIPFVPGKSTTSLLKKLS